MPKNAAAILDEAAKVNGLGGDGLQPWHIRASYQIFGDDGRPQSSGTYEEFWVSDKEYKRSYASSEFTQTDYGTLNGLYRTGNQNWPGYLEMMVHTDLTEPIPIPLDLHGLALGKSRRSFGKVKLECVMSGPVTLISTGSWMMIPTENEYCFEHDRPLLRYVSSISGWDDVLYNEVVSFQGRFLAGDIRIVDNNRVRLAIHVEEVGILSNPKASIFIPPSDAVPVLGSKITLSQETLERLCLRKILPHYPDNAKVNHIEGTVVMHIVVGGDGHVKDVQPVSGPKDLWEAATDSVRGWEYRPFRVLGEPREVEGTVRIVFSVHG